MKRTTGFIAKLCVAALFISAVLLGFETGDKINKTSAVLAIKGYDPVA